MTKPAHTRVTISGVVGTAAAPIERWSCNLSFPAASLANDATDAAADTKAAAVAAAWDNAGMDNQYGLDTILTEARVAAIDATGHTYTRADGSYVQGIASVAIAGANAKQPMPLQTALCVSLNTTRGGPTGKGRFFLPWPALSLDATDKRIPVDQLEPFLGIVTSFLQAVQTAVGGQLQVVSSKGYMTEVTSLRIGRVPDTMRSRREDLVEGYLSGPLA